MRTFKAIDLFAGAGGFSLGMQQAGFDVVAAVEIEQAACDTLRANKPTSFPNMDIIQSDIMELTGADILARVGLEKGELDMLFGGPPCQGFSSVNRRTRSLDNPKSKLVFEFIRMVNEISPTMFMIENVPGLLGFKEFFILLLEALEDCGYVVRFNKMDACSYGVPQHRKRIFIMGVREDCGYLLPFAPPENFSPDMLTHEPGNTFFDKADIAIKCFAYNGFSKEEVHDVYWNTKLHIMMNKKTASDVYNRAVDCCIGDLLMYTVDRSKQEGKKDE